MSDIPTIPFEEPVAPEMLPHVPDDLSEPADEKGQRVENDPARTRPLPVDDEPLSFEGDTIPMEVGSEPVRPPRPFGGRPVSQDLVSTRPLPVNPPGQQWPDLSPAQPLPRRVSEQDTGATRVSPAAYAPIRRPASQSPTGRSGAGQQAPVGAGRRPVAGRPPQRQPASPPRKLLPVARSVPKPGLDSRDVFGCMFRVVFVALFALVLVALCGVSFVFVQYYRIAATLPSIQDLRLRASQFETTRILDRNGSVLYEILDPNAGRRTYVPLAKISPYLVAATIATEDKGFYSHPGFDPMAILRAFWQNYQSGETVSGASTITQQLARALLFSPEERFEQSYQRKIREAILAAEITRRYSKDQILELYLNEIYYGNLAYGVEAAAETYFGTTAGKLTLGQAAFLAGLPQAPAVYDVYTNPEVTFKRLEDVLVLMYQMGQEQGCIYVSNAPGKICLDPVTVTKALDEMKGYSFESPDVQIRYPHWVTYVRSLLESQYDPQRIYRSGFSVYTTLEPALQDAAQAAVQKQVDSLAAQRATDGAVVVLRPATGEILAMVGSADFYNEAISGQVNMAVSPRQPGSAIKPLTYLAAFEKGWTPATLLWDVPSEFPPSGRVDDLRPPYVPVNYDGRFHGPVTVRYALANSYNIPAVKTLAFVGLDDDPGTPAEEGFLAFARRMGITTLTRTDYGLSLTLGGGEVTLLELTGAYAALANSGQRVPPVAISRILDHDGNEVYAYQQPVGQQTIRVEHAYLMSSILSDEKARIPAFGANSVLELPFPAAVKTGTTNDFRDNWTVGYTPGVAVGVWIGNADYTPMQGTSGLSGAAPVWAQVMQAAVQQEAGGNSRAFIRPPGVAEQVICAVSGTSPSPWCPEQRKEIFALGQPPLPAAQDLWQNALIDTWTGLRASPACPDFTEEKFVLNVTDEWARKWIRKDAQGQTWARKMGFEEPVLFSPNRECRVDDPRPRLEFLGLQDGETITGSPLSLYAVVDATQGFEAMRLDFGMGAKPVEWETLLEGRQRLSQPDLLYTWDLTDVSSGQVTLRLRIQSSTGTYAERLLRLNLQVATPTPSATLVPTETPTVTATLTPLPSSTLNPTSTPTPTFSPTVQPSATEPLPATGTPTPTATQSTYPN